MSYPGQTRKVLLLISDSFYSYGVSEEFIRPRVPLSTTLESVVYIQRSVSILRIDGETVIRDIAQQILVEPESIGELIQLILTTAFKAGTHMIPISQMRKLSPVSKLCVSQGGAGL